MSEAGSQPDGSVRHRLLLAGVGGQGVIFATRLLARTAAAMGLPVLASETHGMTQRGGSVLAHLKLGGGKAPLIRRGSVDLLLAFDRDEALRNLTFLRPGAAVFINAADELPAEVLQALHSRAIQVHCSPATQVAMALGSSAVANVVLIGYAAAHPSFPIPLANIREALSQQGPALNLRALQAGVEAAAGTTAEGRRAEVGTAGA